MDSTSEWDWILARHYSAITKDHPDWPEEKKIWVARRRALRTRKFLGLSSNMAD